MYLLLVFLPLLGTILAGFGGRCIGGAGAARIATAGVFTAFLLSLYAFYEVALCQSPCLIRVAP